MKLFDYIFESSIKSSKTITSIVEEMVRIIEDINSIRLSLISLSKVIQMHQVAIEDLCKLVEQQSGKKADLAFPSLKDFKKDDKPN